VIKNTCGCSFQLPHGWVEVWRKFCP